MDHKDKVVVITGASRGLGKALAFAFHSAGARVIATDHTAGDFSASDLPHDIARWPLDVTDSQAATQTVSRVMAEFGRLDVWINNAGVWTPHQPFESVALDEFRRLIEVDYLGTLSGTHAAYKAMLGQKSGLIINILSIRVKDNQPGTVAYASAKGAAWQLTNTLRLEAEPHGIHVVGVFPARMKTQLFEQQMPADYDSYMEPLEVAKRVVENAERDVPSAELIIST